MGFDGFDTTKIRALAGDLDTLSQNAPALHRRLAGVLSRAQSLLDGKAATTSPLLQPLVGDILGGFPFGTFRSLPGSLNHQLSDAQSSMKRRCDQLDGVQKLTEEGYQVDPTLYFGDEKPPDEKKITDLLGALAALDGKDFGSNGNRDDLRKIRDQFADLTPAELDALLSRVPAADLKHLSDLDADDNDGSGWKWWDHNGLPDGEFRDFVSSLVKKAGPSHWATLEAAFPGVQPGFDTTDAWIDGVNPQSGQGAQGMHYGMPTDPLFKTPGQIDVDGIAQGRFGDCWYISSLTATAHANPKFIQDGIKQNPNGTVDVRIWDKDGNLHWVTVTPDLPMDSGGNLLSAHGGGEVWPAYYEKAFALMYGGDDGGAPDGHENDPRYDRKESGDYGAVEWDFTDKAPPYVTGHDSKSIDNDFDSVKKSFQDHHPVIVATPSDDDLKKAGLDPAWDQHYVTRHVFYVKGFDADGKMILGNPWGPGGDIHITADQYKKYFNSPQELQVGG
jgi:hypothetical protein